jgi:hypothetical protein
VADRERPRTELTGYALGAVRVQIGERDAVAVGMQAARDRLAEPSRGPGDDGYGR